MAQLNLNSYLIGAAGEERQRLLTALDFAGLSPLMFDSVDAFVSRAARLDAGIVVLCISCPEASSRHDLKRIESNCNMPIMAVLPFLNEIAVVSALDAGADDCIATYTGVAVVKARLAALWLRFTRSGIPVLRIDRYALDAKRCSIALDGEPIKLNTKSYQLAALMLRRLNEFVPREEIADEVWHREIMKSRTLDVHTCGLRALLHWDGVCGLKLRAVYGKGLLLHRTSVEGLGEVNEN